MKKLIKIALVCFLSISLFGCSDKEDSIEGIEPFTVTLFYLDGCGRCSALKQNLIPKIEETFGDLVTINLVSVENDEGIAAYGEITGYYDEEGNLVEGLLEGFPEAYLNYYYVPFLVVNDVYAFVGYDPNFDDEYIEDMIAGLKNNKMSTTLAQDRFLFK